MTKLLKDWKICGVRVYRTDKNGEVSIESNRSGIIKVKSFFNSS